MDTPEVIYMIVDEKGEMWTNKVYTKLSYARSRRTRLDNDWNRYHDEPRKKFTILCADVSWDGVIDGDNRE